MKHIHTHSFTQKIALRAHSDLALLLLKGIACPKEEGEDKGFVGTPDPTFTIVHFSKSLFVCELQDSH